MHYATNLAKSVAASGSVDISEWMKYGRTYKVLCSHSAGADWTLTVGAVSTRVDTSASAAGQTFEIFKGDDGPYPYAKIAWANGSGLADIFIDVVVD